MIKNIKGQNNVMLISVIVMVLLTATAFGGTAIYNYFFDLEFTDITATKLSDDTISFSSQFDSFLEKDGSILNYVDTNLYNITYYNINEDGSVIEIYNTELVTAGATKSVSGSMTVEQFLAVNPDWTFTGDDTSTRIDDTDAYCEYKYGDDWIYYYGGAMSCSSYYNQPCTLAYLDYDTKTISQVYPAYDLNTQYVCRILPVYNDFSINITQSQLEESNPILNDGQTLIGFWANINTNMEVYKIQNSDLSLDFYIKYNEDKFRVTNLNLIEDTQTNYDSNYEYYGKYNNNNLINLVAFNGEDFIIYFDEELNGLSLINGYNNSNTITNETSKYAINDIEDISLSTGDVNLKSYGVDKLIIAKNQPLNQESYSGSSRLLSKQKMDAMKDYVDGSVSEFTIARIEDLLTLEDNVEYQLEDGTLGQFGNQTAGILLQEYMPLTNNQIFIEEYQLDSTLSKVNINSDGLILLDNNLEDINMYGFGVMYDNPRIDILSDFYILDSDNWDNFDSVAFYMPNHDGYISSLNGFIVPYDSQELNVTGLTTLMVASHQTFTDETTAQEFYSTNEDLIYDGANYLNFIQLYAGNFDNECIILEYDVISSEFGSQSVSLCGDSINLAVNDFQFKMEVVE